MTKLDQEDSDAWVYTVEPVDPEKFVELMRFLAIPACEGLVLSDFVSDETESTPPSD